MARSSAIRVIKKGPPSRHDDDGNPVHNEILLNLPSQEWDVISPKLEFVRLPLHHVLHEAGETIKSGYFCNAGMFSVLTVMPDGKSVEVGLIGKEGFSATPLIAGFLTAYTRTVAQAESTGFRVEAQTIRNALRQFPVLQRQLNRYGQILGAQVTQVATCNRLHDVGQRLARWLLMSQDRIGLRALPLTQDFLAQMLGTRRSSVTVAAGTLQRAGLIAYRRGHVTIINRRKLEASVCDCYAQLQRQTRIWQGQDA
jgi:CRP-like cAMP-binding protein